MDEAAKQFLLYKKYLYMPEYQIMSHVYHVGKRQPTRTPWGRGNGILNDTHGIGIVMLAGIETHRMQNWLQEN
ncbi:hypothetical protein ACFPYJ_21260 [Paenibacillus solisilvae]|uniref:Uncharacterized protein n=1 Tax=Paenibacillus solisilvae TaxID=2486751 RepID=A0ABW0W3K2_9BACL